MSKIGLQLQTLESLWLYYQSHLQSLSMALADVRRIGDGRRLNYVIDGYDFCHWFLSPSHSGAPRNPHHEVIRAKWERFFKCCDGERTCGVLSPFTILEFLHTVARRIDTTPLQTALTKNPMMGEILEALTNEEQTASDLPEEQLAAVRALYGRVLDNKRALKFLSDSEAFGRLRDHIRGGRIRLFDPLIPTSAQRVELFEFDAGAAEEGIRYLRDRRERRRGRSSGEKNRLYDALDVYHFIAVENGAELLSGTDRTLLLVSSGILSRNCWYQVKYRRLPATLATAPDDWRVRTGDVPALLLSALEYTKDSMSEAEEFLEDARSLARMIHRDLLRVPELEACLRDRKQREFLHRTNPPIDISSATLGLMQRLKEQYISQISSDTWDTSPLNAALGTISSTEAREIVEHLQEPAKLTALSIAAGKNIGSEVRSLDLVPPSWRSYVAPLGEDAYELLSSLPNTFGLDL